MRTRTCPVMLMAIFAVSLIVSEMASAASLLKVDFGRNIGNDPGNSSPVQSGFNDMAGNFPLGPDAPAPSLSAVIGAYTVTVSGDPYQGSDYSRVGFEDTSAAASGIDASIRNLYQDALINNLDLNDGSGLNLSIQGVIPNTQYVLKVWSYNAENTIYATPTLFGPRAGSNTTGTSGSVTQFAAPLPTTLDDYSTTIMVSSTTNVLDIHGASTENFGGTRLNGFELSAIPEPAAVSLAGIGALVVGAFRCRTFRRRQA